MSLKIKDDSSVSGAGEEEEGGDRELASALDRAFFLRLQVLLDWDSKGMSTAVVVGSQNIFQGESVEASSHSTSGGGSRGLEEVTMVWDRYTLGVWTTAPGSLGEVRLALQTIMADPSPLLE